MSNENGQHELVEAKRALDRCAEFKMRSILLRVLTHGFRYGLSDREGIIRYTGLLRLSRGSDFLIPHFLIYNLLLRAAKKNLLDALDAR